MNEKKRTKYILLYSYLILIIMGIISFIWFVLIDRDNWFSNFLPNFSTEIVGILLTIFLIDIVVRKNERREIEKRESIALTQLRIPLTNHFHHLFNMYKATATEELVRNYKSLSEVFNEDYFTNIQYLDLYSNAPVVPHVSWLHYLDVEFKRFQEKLDKTIDKYGTSFSVEIIEVFEEMINSGFILMFSNFQSAINFTRTQGFQLPGNLLLMMDQPIRNHINLFLKILEYYNDRVNEEYKIKFDEGLWSNGTAPKIGESRIKN